MWIGKKSHPEDDFKVLAAPDHDQEHLLRGSFRANRKCIVWGGLLFIIICSCFLLLKHDPIKDDGEGFVAVSGLQVSCFGGKYCEFRMVGRSG